MVLMYHLNVVGVHAGKVADRVAHIELNHADDTPSKANNEISIHFQIRTLVDLKRLTLCSSCSHQRCRWEGAG